MKKALLVVSFGTSHEDTRRKTIDRIEAALAAAFPDRSLYRAWTSGMIIRKLAKNGTQINTVSEAMEAMLRDGVTDLLVQPTHILNGVENDNMIRDISAYCDRFERLEFAAPLLSSDDDMQRVVEIFADRFSDLSEDTALVLMGHGTSHYVNPVYAALDYRFKECGHDSVFVATVEAYPALENLIALLKAQSRIRKVLLTPFMIVAGDHAKNDMSGDEEDSWKNQLAKAGYSVECCVRGLGEYDEICDLLVDHARQADRGTAEG